MNDSSTNSYSDSEEQNINNKCSKLLITSKRHDSSKESRLVKQALDFAKEAHKGDRRRTGEPYIIHPIEVAEIVASEIGLGQVSVICSLLHDIAEDTDYTIDDIKNLFGRKVASIISGLTKLTKALKNQLITTTDKKSLINYNTTLENKYSVKGEKLKKLLLSLSDDVRVILIKLADRLHNMRTLHALPPKKQKKICGETLFLYAPIAHRLGLYTIKTELEDLSLKFIHPESYRLIQRKIKNSEKKYITFLNKFSLPISNKLIERGIQFKIESRPKSIYSTWKKMKTKNVYFKHIYDFLAIRIIIEPDRNIPEIDQCWAVYEAITEEYQPRKDRLRDWITTPKENGYEALHTTVRGPDGEWIEVQIRTERMHEIAEKGYAAHWKYKGVKSREGENEWFNKVRDVLENHHNNAPKLFDNFKLSLFSSEIIVFTPKGNLISFPKEVTVLDFAFEIHTELALKCIGAKIDRKTVPRDHKLKSGDKIEILTSEFQTPQKEWINFVVTQKAKSQLKLAFKYERKENIKNGKNIITNIFKDLNITPNTHVFRKIFNAKQNNHITSKDELYNKIGSGKIASNELIQILSKRAVHKSIKFWQLQLINNNEKRMKNNIHSNPKHEKHTIDATIEKGETDSITPPKDIKNYKFTIAKCCNPVPEDKITCILYNKSEIEVHKSDCLSISNPNNLKLTNIVKVKWIQNKIQCTLSTIKIKGRNSRNLINNLTSLISKNLCINMRSIQFETHDDVFSGQLELYIQNTSSLKNLIKELRSIKGVKTVIRVDDV